MFFCIMLFLSCAILIFHVLYEYCHICYMFLLSSFFFFKQKTAYEMRISDWSSDVCSSDLPSGWLEEQFATRCPERIGVGRSHTQGRGNAGREHRDELRLDAQLQQHVRIG